MQTFDPAVLPDKMFIISINLIKKISATHADKTQIFNIQNVGPYPISRICHSQVSGKYVRISTAFFSLGCTSFLVNTGVSTTLVMATLPPGPGIPGTIAYHNLVKLFTSSGL